MFLHGLSEGGEEDLSCPCISNIAEWSSLAFYATTDVQHHLANDP